MDSHASARLSGSFHCSESAQSQPLSEPQPRLVTLGPACLSVCLSYCSPGCPAVCLPLCASLLGVLTTNSQQQLSETKSTEHTATPPGFNVQHLHLTTAAHTVHTSPA